MSRKKRPNQAFANPTADAGVDVSMDMGAQDAFIKSQSVKLRHFMAMPSPIGKKSRGDYRRPDQYDDESVGGLLFKEAGCFSAVMLSNSRGKKDLDGGSMDMSSCRITLPRFYENEKGDDTQKRIYLAPGDKVYVANPEVDVRVVNYQEVEFNQERDNVLQFPAVCIQMIQDSRGITYEEDVDFKLTPDGNIRWTPGAKNPGIDPDTKMGRVYAVRYLYLAHWYIVSLPNEVRIGQVTDGNTRGESRYPYNAQLVREYVYHQRKNSDNQKQKKEFDHGPSREIQDPPYPVGEGPFIKINMSDVEDE